MKTVVNAAELLTLERENGSELYWKVSQFVRKGGRILSVTDANTLVVEGDCDLTVGRMFVVDGMGWEEEFEVDTVTKTSTDAGFYTTIAKVHASKYKNGHLETGDSTDFTSLLVGAFVYQGELVTDKVVCNDLTPEQQPESMDVLVWQADSMGFTIRNDSNEFLNKASESGCYYNWSYDGEVASVTVGDVGDGDISLTMTWTNDPATGVGVNTVLELMSGKKKYFNKLIIQSHTNGGATGVMDNWTQDGFAARRVVAGDIKVGDKVRVTIRPDVYVKLITCYRQMTSVKDEYLEFCGKVDPDSIDDKDPSFIQATAMGHLWVMKGSYAYEVSEEGGRFYKIPGLQIVGIGNAGGLGIEKGPRKIAYKFPDGRNISDINFSSVSRFTDEFTKVIRWRTPNLLSYDEGAFTICVAGDQTFTGGDGIDTLTGAVGDQINTISEGELLKIAAGDTTDIQGVGRATLRFGDGEATDFMPVIDRVLAYTGAAWFDKTAALSSKRNNGVLVHAAVGDFLVILCSRPFWGFKAEFDKRYYFDGATTFEFSAGGAVWTSFTPDRDGTTLGTYEFSGDGVVSWNPETVEGWRPYNEILTVDGGSEIIQQMYGIRIGRSVETAKVTGCTVKLLQKITRCYDSDGVSIDVIGDVERLEVGDLEDDVIVREGSDGELIGATWYDNIPAELLATKLLDSVRIGSTFRSIDSFDVTTMGARVQILGKPGHWGFGAKPTALFWDDAVDILWVGVGDELWKYEQDVGFTFVDRLPMESYGGRLWKLDIMQIAIDSSDNIQIFAYQFPGTKWLDVADGWGSAGGGAPDTNVWKTQLGITTPAKVARLNSARTAFDRSGFIQEATGAAATYVTNIIPGQRHFREGHFEEHIVNGTDHWQNQFIGLMDTHGSFVPDGWGENIYLPIPQYVPSAIYMPQVESHLFLEAGLTDEVDPLDGWSPIDCDQWLGVGYYCLFGSKETGSAEKPYARWTFGQDGWHAWDDVADKWIVFGSVEGYPISGHYGIFSVEADGANSFALTKLIDILDNEPVTCGAKVGSQVWYIGVVKWDETANPTFPANLSPGKIVRVDNAAGWDATVVWDGSGAVGADKGFANASQSMVAGDEKCVVFLSMTYNPVEGTAAGGTVHGCLLNKRDGTYHYYVFDISTGLLYTTKTGSNFIYDVYRQVLAVQYDAVSDKVYGVYTDERLGENSASLVRASFDEGAAAGAEISIELLSAISGPDVTVRMPHLEIDTAGNVFGIAESNTGMIWKFTETVQPMVLHANFGLMSVAEALAKLQGLVGGRMMVTTEGLVRLWGRATYAGSMDIARGMIKSVVEIGSSEEYYEGIEVIYADLSGMGGVLLIGKGGRDRTVLSINNEFITDKRQAELTGNQLWLQQGMKKKRFLIETVPLPQLECLDRVRVEGPVNLLGIVNSIYYLVTRKSPDLFNRVTEIEGTELR